MTYNNWISARIDKQHMDVISKDIFFKTFYDHENNVTYENLPYNFKEIVNDISCTILNYFNKKYNYLDVGRYKFIKAEELYEMIDKKTVKYIKEAGSTPDRVMLFLEDNDNLLISGALPIFHYDENDCVIDNSLYGFIVEHN